ncbi:hypothetical protein BGX27_000765, partial [Mortierella sp. AM989]
MDLVHQILRKSHLGRWHDNGPAVDCRNLTNIQLPRPCRFSDPEIPRGFYVDVAAAAPHDESQLILGAVGGDHTVNYGSENIAGIVALDMVTRARNGVGLFDETFLISLMDKCPRLSTFVMVGFPFDHDQLIRQIGDRLAQPRATTSTATAPTPIVSDTVSDLTGSASALTITQPTGLKKLELTNLYYCRVRAKSIEYLLSHCTSEMEELLLSISFGSRADLGDGDGDDEDGIQGVEQEQEQSGSGTGHSSVVTQACPPCFEDDGREWKLWRLVIKGDLSGQGPLIWLPLLRKCSNLQEICIDVFKHGTIEHLAQTLSQCCPKVSEITLQCMTGGPQEDSVIAALIQSSRSWRRLSISFLHGFGPLSIGALIRHSATLETLILEECDGIYSEDIQGVLSSCVNLKTFRAMTSNGVDFSSTVYLDAADMMEDPWVCLGLENLKLVIVGVARPDLQEDQYGEPLLGPLHDGSITEPELQRVVYRQLGKLTRLRELWLGHDKQDLDDEDNYHPTDVEGQWQFIDPDEQFECLDFSLKSGLSLLSGLSDLRVLNIDRMKTRIGLSEVQWMVKQWPKLERIIGLVIQGENVPKHVQWFRSVDCRNLTRLEFPKGCQYSDPKVPRMIFTDYESDFLPTSPSSSSLSPSLSTTPRRSTGEQAVRYGPGGPRRSAPGYKDNESTDWDKPWMFDETVLIAVMEKCPKLSVFIMFGFSFGHYHLVRQFSNRLGPSAASINSSNLALARRFTELRRLELTSPPNINVKTDLVAYLLDHCALDLEELLICNASSQTAETVAVEKNDIGNGMNFAKPKRENGTTKLISTENAETSHHEEEVPEWKLWKLTIEGDICGYGPLTWLPLLERCFQLQEFHLDVYGYTVINQLALALKHSCPKLSDISLHCRNRTSVEDSAVADLILAPPSLKRLSMKEFNQISHHSVEALVRRSTTLEALVLEDCLGITSSIIQAVLSSCPKLKEFRAFTSEDSPHPNAVPLSARDLVHCTWVCLNLEVLQVTINGIVRPDLMPNQHGTPPDIELQKVVYEQLGKLTKLKELWLGHITRGMLHNSHHLQWNELFPYIIPDAQTDCLEFSLKSGLGLLQGLKELKVLSLQMMNVRIGIPEVQWMAEQWPSLKVMSGVLYEGQDVVPDYIQWIRDNRPEIEIPLGPK